MIDHAGVDKRQKENVHGQTRVGTPWNEVEMRPYAVHEGVQGCLSFANFLPTCEHCGQAAPLRRCALEAEVGAILFPLGGNLFAYLRAGDRREQQRKQ